MHRVSGLVVISILLTACAPQPTPTATSTACQPSEIQISSDSFPEIKGSMKSDGEMWALLFFDKAHINTDLKIVWRITGEEGDFHAQAENEAGTVITPVWGPDHHESSTWQRPGEEWGTGFNFPESGCWTITVTRGDTIGEIALDILNP